MNKHLLVAASALLVGLSFGSNAWAGSDNDIANAKTAVAASVQYGDVQDNWAGGTVGSNDTGTIGGTGLINVQQNNGANSILQDANTLGAILNCSCTNSSSSENANTTAALALNAQVASVENNTSNGATNKSSTDSDKGGGEHWGSWGKGGHDNYSTYNSNAVGSTNFIGGVTGTGLINISQNNGNNSMLQSSNTVAAIIGK